MPYAKCIWKLAQTATSYNVSHHDQHNGEKTSLHMLFEMILNSLLDFHSEWINKTFSRAQMFSQKWTDSLKRHNWNNSNLMDRTQFYCYANHGNNRFQISPISMTKIGPSEKNLQELWASPLTHPDLFSLQTCKERSSSCCLSAWLYYLLEECWASSVCWQDPTCCCSWPESCFCSAVSTTFAFTSDWATCGMNIKVTLDRTSEFSDTFDCNEYTMW